MTKRSAKPYLFLLAAVLLVMSLPKSMTESIRGITASILSPGWTMLSDAAPSHASDLALHKLQLENKLLNGEVRRLQDLLKQECTINTQLKTLSLSNSKTKNPQVQKERHQEILNARLSYQLQAIPAQVIFRSPSTWNSSLWVNVGESDNKISGNEVIAKNSPVLVGTSIVGVIDFVGKHQSRVRLITDSGLNPSVRAVRGDLHKRMVAENIAILMNRFSCCHGLFSNQEEKELMLKQLAVLQKRLYQDDSQGSWYLAKGELHGASEPLWRSPSSILRGIGFNYDFPDEEGPARDLRTGTPVNGSEKDKTLPILLVNDLLVTTGMDGVFPAGFHVAEVTKIQTLREGDYFYELEARPTAGNLQELSTVFVIPPVRKENI